MKVSEAKVGDRFGKLVILNVSHFRLPTGKWIYYFNCICDCGKIKAIRACNVLSGSTVSCGCYGETIFPKISVKHGVRYDPLYYKWRTIRNRCHNPNDKDYERYGARGIELFGEWRKNPKLFIEYCKALDNYGKEKYTLDRINTYGNYEPGNLRFADPHMQAANRRRIKSKTGYTGVQHSYKDKFAATITVNRKTIQLGTFLTIEEGVNARNKFIIDNNLLEYPIQVIGQLICPLPKPIQQLLF